MAILDDYKPRKTSRGYVWLKLFTDLVDEPAFMQLSDQAKAVYFEVYILAGRSDAGGLVTASDKPATVDSLAWLLRRSSGELQSALDELARSGLVDLQGGQVTVCRFGNEQGPSMDDKRAQWALDQRKSRARAKGEPEPDAEPDADAKPDEGKNKNSDGVKELKEFEELKTSGNNNNKNKNKSVSRMSDNSQAIVRPDSGSSSLFNEYVDEVLTVWQAKTGKKYTKNGAFYDLCSYWFDEHVTIGHVSEAIDLVQAYAEPNTPMYLQNVAINVKNNGPKDALEEFRKLWQANQDGEQ